MSRATGDWAERNQRHLMTALDQVRHALRRHTAGTAPGEPIDAPPEEPGRWALPMLTEAFGLSLFERDVLLLCAGGEFDAAFPALCAEAQGDPRRTYPTFGLALAALPGAHWSALAPDAPLRYWRMIEASGSDLTTSPLRIDERVLHYLAGVSHVDDRLEPLVELVHAPTELPPSHAALAERVTGAWAQAEEAGQYVAIELCGPEPEFKRLIAAAAGARWGLRVHLLAAGDIPSGAAERETLRRLWDREAVLSRSALLLDASELEGSAAQRAVCGFVERLRGPVLVSAREPLRGLRRVSLRLDVDLARPAEQRAMWDATLGGAAASLNGELDAIVQQFHLNSSAVRSASAAIVGDGPVDAHALWDACRAQARPQLEDLGQRLAPGAVWSDLVLPAPQLALLREIEAHVRRRSQVYERWGFAAKGSRGLGISALFAGASGTGKTLAAEVLAADLRLDLYRIDLSQVVSKYIGETEKNLRRVFEAAEAGGAILLFDEADALFGKRSEVKDSHDRYANIEVSYLLQRMEAYRGLAILTTNMKSALDPAFLRRLRFVVEFPFPDGQQRAEIWRRMLPSGTPTDGLVVEQLARLAVAGGSIRNIALHAAFLAADAGEPVRMSHVLAAARREYAKLERPLSEAEVGGWA